MDFANDAKPLKDHVMVTGSKMTLPQPAPGSSSPRTTLGVRTPRLFRRRSARQATDQLRLCRERRHDAGATLAVAQMIRQMTDGVLGFRHVRPAPGPNPAGFARDVDPSDASFIVRHLGDVGQDGEFSLVGLFFIDSAVQAQPRACLRHSRIAPATFGPGGGTRFKALSAAFPLTPPERTAASVAAKLASAQSLSTRRKLASGSPIQVCTFDSRVVSLVRW